MNGFKVSQLMSMNIQGPGSSLTSSAAGSTQNSKFAQLLDARSAGSNLTSTSASTTGSAASTTGSAATGSASSTGTTGTTSSDQPDDATMQSMAMFFQGLQQKPAQMEEYDNDNPPPPTDGS